MDNVAATLYPGDAPTQLKPVMCIGDGNCLFRAFSNILFGDEDHHTELRMRSISELAKNEDHYLDENYLLALTGASNVVKSLLPSSVNVISKDPITSFRKEVLRTVRSFTFANMWHIFSLSNALGCRVVSVYPKVENPGTNRSLLNITIQPSTPTTFLEPVNLMWSHCSDTRKKGWGPNHFVPLLSADASGSQGDTWSEKVKSKGKLLKRKTETTGEYETPGKRKASASISPQKQGTSSSSQQPSAQPATEKHQNSAQSNGAASQQKSEATKDRRQSDHPKDETKDQQKGDRQTKATKDQENLDDCQIEESKHKEKADDQKKAAKGQQKADHPCPKEKVGSESTLSPRKPKANQGAGSYHCGFKKAWSKEWTFITAANGTHSFHCAICNRNVSCKHQGRTDVERHIRSALHEANTKTAEGQCRLPFFSKQDPIAEKVC